MTNPQTPIISPQTLTWLEQMAISIMIGLIQSVIKNPAHREALRTIMLTIRDDINLAYPDSALHTLEQMAHRYQETKLAPELVKAAHDALDSQLNKIGLSATEQPATEQPELTPEEVKEIMANDKSVTDLLSPYGLHSPANIGIK
jgi:SpoVK/Ycf46/Vps4 family AAA+-type ATPase